MDLTAPPLKDKQRFTILVAVCGVIFFFINITLPFLFLIPGLILGLGNGQAGTQTYALLDRGAFWEGKWWYLEQVERIGADGGATAVSGLLKSLPVGAKASRWGAPKEHPVSIAGPALLADRDRLWIIGADQVGLYRRGALELFTPRVYLGNSSNPFLYKGFPAVLEQSPAGLSLKTFEDGQWVTGPSLNLAYQGEEEMIFYVKVLSQGERAFLFTALDGHLHYQQILPDALEASESRWIQGEAVSEYWDVFLSDGRLHFITCEESCESGRLSLFKEEGGIWFPAGSHDAGMALEQLSAYPAPDRGSFLIAFKESGSPAARLMEALPSGLEQRGAFVAERSGGDEALQAMDTLSLVSQLVTLAASLAFVFLMDWMIKRYKPSRPAPGGPEYASVLRRAAAGLVDGLIVLLILAAGACAVLYPLIRDGQCPSGFGFWPFLALIGMVASVLVAGWLGYSYLEGKYGQTPGKRLVGIRVLRTDLTPCGFGPALLRNLLRVIDGFSSYAVGLVTIALTERNQRVGDLAAKTVVLRK